MARRRRINEFLTPDEQKVEAKGQRHEQAERCEVELAAKMAAEKAISLLSRRVLKDLEECRSLISDLAERLDRIEKMLAREGGKKSSLASSKKSSLESRVEEYLDKNRYLLMSEARQKLKASPVRVREAAENVGAVALELEGDVALIMPEHLEEFEALLREAKTPDPAEAAEKVGPYKRLFEKLRRSGLVYFDSVRGYWRRL